MNGLVSQSKKNVYPAEVIGSLLIASENVDTGTFLAVHKPDSFKLCMLILTSIFCILLPV